MAESCKPYHTFRLWGAIFQDSTCRDGSFRFNGWSNRLVLLDFTPFAEILDHPVSHFPSAARLQAETRTFELFSSKISHCTIIIYSLFLQPIAYNHKSWRMYLTLASKWSLKLYTYGLSFFKSLSIDFKWSKWPELTGDWQGQRWPCDPDLRHFETQRSSGEASDQAGWAVSSKPGKMESQWLNDLYDLLRVLYALYNYICDSSVRSPSQCLTPIGTASGSLGSVSQL